MMHRIAVLVTAAVLPIGLFASPAAAHPTAAESEVASGSTSMMTFQIEHGCDGSPTVSVSLLIPEGIESVVVPPKDAWDATSDGTTVTWTGGPAAADEVVEFVLSALVSAPAGETLYFPILQECVEGQLRWFDIPGEGQSAGGLELPAAAFRVVEGAQSPQETTTTAPAATTTTAPAGTTTTVPVETTTTAPEAAVPVPGEANGGFPIGLVALAVAGVAVGLAMGVYARRRAS